MEKKKRWLINFLYYGMIFSIGCLIVYILFKKCLIVVLSYLSAILLKPFIDLILERLHIKNNVFSNEAMAQSHSFISSKKRDPLEIFRTVSLFL